MSHAAAALTPRAPLRPARLTREDGWPIDRAATERRGLSWPTAKRFLAHGHTVDAAVCGRGAAGALERRQPATQTAHRWLAAGGSEGGLMEVAGWTRPDMLMRHTKAPAAARDAAGARTLNLGEL